jgi:hypothetical protein
MSIWKTFIVWEAIGFLVLVLTVVAGNSLLIYLGKGSPSIYFGLGFGVAMIALVIYVWMDLVCIRLRKEIEALEAKYK